MDNQITKFMSRTKVIMVLGVAFGYFTYKAINTLQNKITNLEKTVKELNDWKEGHVEVVNLGSVPLDSKTPDDIWHVKQ